jgi:hypothetical protein
MYKIRHTHTISIPKYSLYSKKKVSTVVELPSTVPVCMVATVTHNGGVVALLIWLDVTRNGGSVASQESK